MLAGLEVDQRQSAALAACVAVQAHKAELRRSSHITELTAGIANLIIGLQVFFLKQYNLHNLLVPLLSAQEPLVIILLEGLTPIPSRQAVSIVATDIPHACTDPKIDRNNPLFVLAVSR